MKAIPSNTDKTHVIFDFDLTLLPEESLLAVLDLALRDHRQEMRLRSRLRALSAPGSRLRPRDILGMLPLNQAIRRSHVREYVQTRSARLAPEIRATVDALKANNVTLWLLSTAYMEWVQPLATAWGFDARHVRANRFMWIGERAFCVRPSTLLTRMGKATIVKNWHARGMLDGTVIMIGDSASDRRVYTTGQSDGFIQAAYYADSPETLPQGNSFRARHTKDLSAILQHLSVIKDTSSRPPTP